MSNKPTVWGDAIGVEMIAGVPFRMYTERPKRIEHAMPLADHWGTRPYIVQGERTITFDRLRQASASKASVLRAAGVAAGDRVLLIGWNGPDWVLNFWAIVEAGAVPVLGNAWWGAEEIGHALQLLKPSLVLADARCATKLPAGTSMGVWEVDERERPRAAALQWPTSDDENAPAAIIFTSGTEGSAKAVVLSHRALLATQQMLLHVTRRLPFHPNPTYGETTLQTGPLFHIGGIGALLRGVMLGNTLVYLSGRFDPGETLGLMERYKITRWNAVPTMASRLIEHPDVRTRDLSALRTLTLGGAPVHAELLARIREALPALDARIATGYGLSENGGQATASSGADTAVRPGSAGRSLPLAEVKIMDRPDKPDGEVLVRSPTQMSGYYGDKKSPIDAEGWLHTGDLGRLDERGHLWITGRSKDIIIRGGENIAPASIERALLGVPGVSEAVVFGVPHPDLGEEVAAIVVVEGEQTAEQLQERVRASVASFAVPSRWRLQREPLPVNQTGKIDKPAIVAGFRREVASAARR